MLMRIFMKRKYLFVLPIICALASCSSNSEITGVDYELTDFASKVEFHTSEQIEVFINNIESVMQDNNLNYREPYNTRLLSEDMTLPLAVSLSWKAKAKGGSISSYRVIVSENKDLSNPSTFTSKKAHYDFYNAKVDTTYYWAVKVGKFVSDTHSFATTTTKIRNIYVDGVNNVRDLGGYGSIKQGLLYRGGAFEKYNKNTKKVEINISKAGVSTLKEQLGIKTEVDLRRNDEDHENCDLTKSTVSGLNYVALPMQYGGKNILTYDDEYHNPNKIKSFFELLANEANYPIYFHCSQGKDRTGCLAYLLEALMGEEVNDLYLDYLFSSFSAYKNEVKPTGISGYYGETLDKYGEESWTLAQKVESYLVNVLQISAETIVKVKSIIKA